jgi:hypothetical protein
MRNVDLDAGRLTLLQINIWGTWGAANVERFMAPMCVSHLCCNATQDDEQSPGGT